MRPQWQKVAATDDALKNSAKNLPGMLPDKTKPAQLQGCAG
jgi:hypothetical protein